MRAHELIWVRVRAKRLRVWPKYGQVNTVTTMVSGRNDYYRGLRDCFKEFHFAIFPHFWAPSNVQILFQKLTINVIYRIARILRKKKRKNHFPLLSTTFFSHGKCIELNRVLFANIIRVASSGFSHFTSPFLRATVESSREYQTSCSFRRENIDIRGGFSVWTLRAPQRVRCFRSRAHRPEHQRGTRSDVSASSKIREKPIRRGSASGCS